MLLKKTLVLSILIIVPLNLLAQNVAHNAVHHTQQSFQNSIRGTLDSVVNIPQKMANRANQLVFPRNIDQNFNINPWSNKPHKNHSRRQKNYSSLPKGNPWAPIGDTQNIPFDRTAVFEKNPYTDAPVPIPRSDINSLSYSNNPYMAQNTNRSFNNNGFNNSFDGANGAFSSPFGNQFWPTNQFWPGGNNANSSMPFMPW